VNASHALGLLRSFTALALLCQCSSDPPAARTGGDAGSGGRSEGGASAGLPGGGAGSGGSAGNPGESGMAGALGGSAPAGGAAGVAGAFVEPEFMLGADISSMQEAVDAGTSYVDTDGVSKGLLELLRGHGFNYVRLRTFVDPTALYGYANPTGEDQFRKSESYCDKAHTLQLAQQVKQAGMGFLLDLHYSDNWADPGKQIIPEAWRDAGSIEELAAHVETYTNEVVSALMVGGARPDMVQIGNEITPGLLIHVPGANPDPDQWGNINKVTNAVNGSTANVDNVARLLKAGIAGVKAVDPSIRIMLHLENTESFPAVRDWVNGVRSRGVELDVLGLSCYTAFQGDPAIWQDTFEQLATSLDDVSFVIAEYNPEATRANRIMADLPDRRGLGTFFWEPTQGGAWGPSLFTFVNGAEHANADAFAEFDALKASLGL
jgi:arabinogalactan endo-1,4-beta-galactosidase